MQQMDRDRDKNGSSNAHSSSLLDKQLEEILRTAERSRRRQLFWRRVRGVVSGMAVWPRRGRRVSAGRLMGMGFALCVLAGLFSRAVPWLATLLVLAGALLFLSPIVLNFGRRGASGGRDQRIWRGRVIEYSDGEGWRTTQAWFQKMLRRMRGGPPGRSR